MYTKEKHWTWKQLASLALLLCAVWILVPAAGEAKVKAPKMECHSYVVMDAGSGEVLFGQEEDKQIYPASTAKLMTAIVCIENGDVNSKIKTKADIVYNTTPGTYNVGIGAGVKFRFKDLLAMSLIASSADATDTLADGVFGSKKACAEAMTEKCRQLGLTKTSFDNPVGSDIGGGFDKTYSTATEMALITRYAMAMPLIREIVKYSHYDVTSGQEISVNSTNRFLRGLSYYSRDKYRIIGSKSGTTNAAGHVFIATATDNEGHEVICAYFGNVSKESTFSSIRKLLDYTFKQYKKGKITLSPKYDDVRNDESIREVFDTYAALHCYPADGKGRFCSQTAINRTQLAQMLQKVNELEGNAVLSTFVSGNQKGTVTAARAAELIQDIYPNHISKEEEKEILSGCAGIDGLTEEQREAFAICIKHKIFPDESCHNAKQILTRKQALLLADHLSDYQVQYAASHPVAATEEIVADVAGGSGTHLLAGPAVLWNTKWTKKMEAQIEAK